ncbi:MAG: thymidine kinase, partial [Chitinophagaceae bacterium]
NIVSHDESMVKSTPIDNSQTILLFASGVDVVGIDEAQFFDEQLPDVCDQLALRGTRVIIAGLDMDFKARPFGQMPNLLARADFITKLHAICVKCGNIANYSYRRNVEGPQLMLGEKDLYEPRCRQCYYHLD